MTRYGVIFETEPLGTSAAQMRVFDVECANKDEIRLRIPTNQQIREHHGRSRLPARFVVDRFRQYDVRNPDDVADLIRTTGLPESDQSSKIENSIDPRQDESAGSLSFPVVSRRLLEVRAAVDHYLLSEQALGVQDAWHLYPEFSNIRVFGDAKWSTGPWPQNSEPRAWEEFANVLTSHLRAAGPYALLTKESAADEPDRHPAAVFQAGARRIVSLETALVLQLVGLMEGDAMVKGCANQRCDEVFVCGDRNGRRADSRYCEGKPCKRIARDDRVQARKAAARLV
jgi:hypothetical protein